MDFTSCVNVRIGNDDVPAHRQCLIQNDTMEGKNASLEIKRGG